MIGFGEQRAKLYERFGSVVNADGTLMTLAGTFSKKAREALAEAETVEVEKVYIRLKKLPKALDGFRIIQLSDIHHSPFTSSKFISDVIKLANDLKPDMFVLTGDYVSHELEYIAPVAEMLGELRSEFGTFACLGNHDHWTDAELLTSEFRRNNIDVLINQGFRFSARNETFWLCGVDDFGVGKTNMRAALRGSYSDEMKLLLCHNPAAIRRAAYWNIDLMLSGHTHGGQVKIREPRESVLFPNRRKRSANGLHYRRETQVYITRGIGTVVVPLRYQCPPEISLIELKATDL
jgi:uncharacterized protein